mmetsp:Transcript_54514/g.90392  ORF Transcript_54514/g.90392 Transcript_54514/m.90392 type:complete len:94 (+) Transcript_54514:211-492(+)
MSHEAHSCAGGSANADGGAMGGCSEAEWIESCDGGAAAMVVSAQAIDVRESALESPQQIRMCGCDQEGGAADIAAGAYGCREANCGIGSDVGA